MRYFLLFVLAYVFLFLGLASGTFIDWFFDAFPEYDKVWWVSLMISLHLIFIISIGTILKSQLDKRSLPSDYLLPFFNIGFTSSLVMNRRLNTLKNKLFKQ